MKIKFEENLNYQLDAISSVTDIFRGQEITRNVFTVEKLSNEPLQLGKNINDLGVGNGLLLYPDEILKNLHEIQIKKGLPKTKDFKQGYNFSVEMETGTGKTYVYIRSIMELNKKYGFTKFIIVVPSIAIKEGVFKTLQITNEHFKGIYDNVPYDYYIYDSKKLNKIRDFASNDNIQIMIMTIDSFNKDTNVINKERDQANGYKPIEYIKQCNPIVIMDEPQNMETDIAKEAIKELNPLCTLRYSATHKNLYSQVFKLNSIDAYERKLVKQIEVATIGLTKTANTEYIKLTKVTSSKSGISAKVEIDSKTGARKEITIKLGDDLAEKVKRSIYDGYIVNEITINPDDSSKSFVDFGKVRLTLGQINGGEDPDTIKRLQIRKTIEEHLEKQKRLKHLGIKVLSLFFIDRVANYRTYNKETGEAEKGKYALMFEEEYEKAMAKSEYHDLWDIFDTSIPLYQRAGKVHDGYFSSDKKKSSNGKEYFEEKDTKGTTSADEDTFNKIMRDKEKLLSFKEPLSFIFSHSALKEGWDNPNVFQICTLNETTSEMKKRQEIGRGLRIAVNQQGERVRDFDINILTVMANESYEDFVTKLQKETEEEAGIKFGYIENYIFTNIIKSVENENEIYLGHEKSEEIYKFLQENDYIDDKGNAEIKLKEAIENGKIDLPEEFSYLNDEIIQKLKSSVAKLTIKNAEHKEVIKVNKKILLSEDFRQLWDKIKYQTTYQVDFDSEKLIEECKKAIDENIFIPDTKAIFSKSRLKIIQAGIQENESYSVNEEMKMDIVEKHKLPDIITYLQNETNLTRKSIVKILTGTKTLESFKKNPQKYLEDVGNIVKRTMKHFVVDGIKYQKIGENNFYCQELFQTEELIGYLKTEKNKEGNMMTSTKSPYSHLVFDSNVESSFAKDLEINKNVLLYTKLPSWFKIETPLGNYNPDWAILVKPDINKEDEKLYFVVETKGSLFEMDRRETENLKIKCGKKHFKALETNIELEVASSFNSLSEKF